MRVRINAAGHDVRAFGVEHRIALKIVTDGRNPLTLDENIGLIGSVCGKDGAVLDDCRHCHLPSWARVT
jgi:hypothetical protein